MALASASGAKAEAHKKKHNQGENMYAVWSHLETGEIYEMKTFENVQEAFKYANKKLNQKKTGTVAINKVKKNIDKGTLLEYNEGENDRNEDSRN